MLQGEHSAKFSTFIKLLLVIKIFVLSTLEWPHKSGFTVAGKELSCQIWLIEYCKFSGEFYFCE